MPSSEFKPRIQIAAHRSHIVSEIEEGQAEQETLPLFCTFWTALPFPYFDSAKSVKIWENQGRL